MVMILTDALIKEGFQGERTIASLEEEIFTFSENPMQAKAALRTWLFCQLGEEGQTGTIGDALSRLSREESRIREVPIILIRCLALENLLPEPNQTNQIERFVVQICEKWAPDLCSFLKLDTKAQNYQKFSKLSQGHSIICQELHPLYDNYGDFQTLLGAQKKILGCLNHSIVRGYCNPFRLHEFKNIIESLLNRFNRVAALGSTFSEDFEESRRAIDELNSIINEHKSFLAQYFKIFSKNLEHVLIDFLYSVRSQFNAMISKAWGSNNDLPKRYPLHEEGREFQIIIPMRNVGNGLAIDVEIEVAISCEEVCVSNQSILLGCVKPGEFSVVLDALIISETDGFNGLLEVRWGEIGNPQKRSAQFEFGVKPQDKNVNWASLEYSNPYSTAVAEGESFIGRGDIVKVLASKLLRMPMEPFYITGQKRVGKTSLVLAAAGFVSMNAAHGIYSCHYVLWGDVAHYDPATCIRLLGESIEKFVFDNLDIQITTKPGDYQGSLAPLVKLSELALKVNPDRKFVIIIDEFDEIPQELFLQGNLAETFFANLRAISRRGNIGLVLVGGENMPFIMDRQGQKLNNFSRINLSYFSRTKEWSDFQLMIRKPTEGLIKWHEDAISEIFNVSNGNPYFAKIVCAGVFKNAIEERDTDVTATEVKAAMEREISALGTNSFAHLWQDGIPKPVAEREPDILRRSRVLVAAARCSRQCIPLTVSELACHKTSASLTETEILAVLRDFGQRDVLREMEGKYSFVLPIFGEWLKDVGAQHLIADSLSEELANAVLVEENAVSVKSEEVVALAHSWPTYRGRQIGCDEIRAWYQQVESPKDQRLLFRLLQRTKFFRDVQIREKLREAFSMLRVSIPTPIIRVRNQRRNDIIVTHIDNLGKSGTGYASLFAEENRLAPGSVISPASINEKLQTASIDSDRISAVVIIDDIAGTGRSLSEGMSKFIECNQSVLRSVKIFVMTLVATEDAQKLILRNFAKYEDLDIEFRSCEILAKEHYAFPEDKSGFANFDDWDRAKALCQNLGTSIDKSRPFGFGGMGLLVVFPTNVPNNTLPIIRSHSRGGSSTNWTPLFERISH